MSIKPNQSERAEQFHQLHYQESPLILPNIWDPLGALMLQSMGYKALATSSSAVAQVQGYPDGEKLPFKMLLERLKLISDSVSLPLSADIESAYASSITELEDHINMLLDTGIVGINYEDSDKKSGELIDINEQCKRIETIRKTAQQRGIRLFVNARVDAYVHADHLNFEQKLEETIKRGKAYKEAGADCIFPILITDFNQIQTLIEEVDLPLNVMAFPGIPDLNTLKNCGVRRISLGGGFLKIAIQPLKKLAEKLQHLEGLDEIFDNEINSAYINSLIEQNNFD